ncbi:MAG: histidinol dehydrogenase [Nitrospirae bacterium]|nr:histidinol dehydrogenase [Nitrospirota bacterium]
MKVIKLRSRAGRRDVEKLIHRGEPEDRKVEQKVRKMLDDVQAHGDVAVSRYTKQFDKMPLSPKRFLVTLEERAAALAKTDPKVVDALRFAADRIYAFHSKQQSHSWSFEEAGVTLGQQLRPLASAGLYVPGGKAAYPSSVLMNGIPAKVAGVERVVMCTPTPKGEMNPYVLVAADLVGIHEVYRIGGVQAIGAMAYGTKTIRRVDKIVGPGNAFVATAKRLVYGTVDIDMIAGPSEILIIADETAHPAHVAADILSQAEHDEEAWTILVAPSDGFLKKVQKEIAVQLAKLDRRKIAEASLKHRGIAVVVPEILDAIAFANDVAPEHLELAIERPYKVLKYVKNAGSVFLGHHTPQALGDYLAGPNHVLPTGGTARFFSPLSVEDFTKKSGLIAFSQDALRRFSEKVVQIARVEGLGAHAEAVEIRLRPDD